MTGDETSNLTAGQSRQIKSARILATARASRTDTGAGNRFVEIVSAAVFVQGAKSLRISVIKRTGAHLRLPLLANSRVGSVKPAYWRKTIVTGPVSNPRLGLQLRIPKRLIRHGSAYAVRVRALGLTGMRTIYIPFHG